jgi:tRNA-2-methylthio-N6-dimethylallyladenosine synthase
MNIAESAAMEQTLKERGWSRRDEAANGVPATPDLLILNTCSVRATAEQRILGRLGHWAARKKEGRPFKILIAGCAAANIAGTLTSLGADYVLPPAQKHRFTTILTQEEKRLHCVSPEDEAADFFAKKHYTEGMTSVFVPVMHGCNNFCSYCIVPYVRGNEISRPVESIISEIDFLAEKGVSEITLLGQNVNAYRSGPFDFAGLVRLVARRIEGTSIRWVRFLAGHPKDVNDSLIEALAENPCFCRHIHLPVQHGSDRILLAMNRRYTSAAYRALVCKLKSALPNLTLTTDILVGFPGETDEDFAHVLSLMEDIHFNFSFMYHYNPRRGTAAYALPGRINEEIKRERLSRVIELQKTHTKSAMEAALEEERLVLCDKPSRKNPNEFLCHSEHDEQCVVNAACARPGAFLQVRLIGLHGNTFKTEHTSARQSAAAVVKKTPL